MYILKCLFISLNKSKLRTKNNNIIHSEHLTGVVAAHLDEAVARDPRAVVLCLPTAIRRDVRVVVDRRRAAVAHLRLLAPAPTPTFREWAIVGVWRADGLWTIGVLHGAFCVDRRESRGCWRAVFAHVTTLAAKPRWTSWNNNRIVWGEEEK